METAVETYAFSVIRVGESVDRESAELCLYKFLGFVDYTPIVSVKSILILNRLKHYRHGVPTKI